MTLLPEPLVARLGELARTPVLLVACDYDGTLSPHVPDPGAAVPDRASFTALRALAALPDTHVAVISGRALRDLAALSRLPHEVRLVGSHGAEWDLGFANELPVERAEVLDECRSRVEDLVRGVPGAVLERKPAGFAVHVRNVPDRARAHQIPDQVAQLLADLPDVKLTPGKEVIEVSVVPTNKGQALDNIRHQVNATGVIFAGDDVTDETAFARLAGGDVGVKVGPGETLARYRVDDTEDVSRLLALLFERRQEWLRGGSLAPINHHSVIASGRTTALIDPSASVVWWCAPNPESSAVFASLVGGASGGYWTVRPVSGEAPLSQRYEGNSLVLRTRWPGISLIDQLQSSDPSAPDGRSDRLVRTVRGKGRVVVDFRPRFDFGRLATGFVEHRHGLEVGGSRERVVLVAPGVRWSIGTDGPHEVAMAEIDLDAMGGEVTMAMCWGRHPTDTTPVDASATRIDSDVAWVGGLRLPGVATELVARSALSLRALVHEPSGAVLAAATTSLPEDLGGVRNWDYRYCWIRDASVGLSSLVRLGSTSEAVAFLGWLDRVIERIGGADRLVPLYTAAGGSLLPEAVVSELSGYAGSRPVRIGNAADMQVQIDVIGFVIELFDLLAAQAPNAVSDRWQLVEHLADEVCSQWMRPDHGIWEVRLAPRHHVNSRAMCWTALDRAIGLADRFGKTAPAAWAEARDAIRADVLAHGVSPATGALTTAFGQTDLDAACLVAVINGMLEPDHPVALATVDEVESQLRVGPTVYRYRCDDGLPGNEGGFHLCTGWLIRAFVTVGRLDDARELFQRFVRLAGPTGILSEEHHPEHDVALGNVPQAYSHSALIDAALALDAVR